MNITEFLLERIAEDERDAKVCLSQPEHTTRRWKRVLAECKAKRAVIKFHEEWPVLVEKRPTFEETITDMQSMSYRLIQESQWLTEQEYIKRFGAQPPTTPILRALATIYADDPDYQPEWAE